MAKIDVMTAAGGKRRHRRARRRRLRHRAERTAVMHQVVTAQLAARGAGTHSTLTRREVRGGGAKPWKQKGTGRARAGSSTVPQWRGGGVAMGPKPRDYSQRTPKKMKRLALHSALSDRAAEGKVRVVDAWSFDAPKTRTRRLRSTRSVPRARSSSSSTADRRDRVEELPQPGRRARRDAR